MAASTEVTRDSVTMLAAKLLTEARSGFETVWICPGMVDTFLSRSVLFFQSNLLELSRA
jgi:hypothetical protein